MSATRALAPWVVGAVWGALASAPLVIRARRHTVVARLGACVAGPRDVRPSPRGRVQLPRTFASSLQEWRRRRAAAQHSRRVVRELPVAADVLAVAVSAGCTPYLAVVHATRWGPPLVAAHLRGVVDAVELGSGFAESLGTLAARVPALRGMCDAIATATEVGNPLAPALLGIADGCRRSARRAAEEHARRVSVRLLFPLVFLVLPAFVLLAVVPGIAAGLGYR